jgi:ASC-1-like (ASCH) protein
LDNLAVTLQNVSKNAKIKSIKSEMLHQQSALVSKLRKLLPDDLFWVNALSPKNQGNFCLHLAIFREPYLKYILEGRKTVETRFAKRACPPFDKVADGDILVLKRAGGPVLALCTVEKVWFYRLKAGSLDQIKQKFGEAICPAVASFWQDRKDAAYATLMLIGHVTPVKNIEIKKRDRRGWVTFKNPQLKSILYK